MTPTAPSKKRSLDARLLRETRATRGTFTASAAATTLLGVLMVTQALLLSRVIAAVFLRGAALEQVTPDLLALVPVILLRALLTYGGALAAARMALNIKNALRERFTARLYALGPAFTQGERSGELTLTAGAGLDKLDGYYRDYLPAVWTALTLPLLILAVVLPLDALTFVVLLVTAPLIPFFMALIGMAAGVVAKQQFFEMRHVSAHFLDVMQGLTTLKLFNRSRHQLETIRRITERFRAATMRVLRVAFLSALTLELLATLSVAIVAVEIGVRLVHGGIAFEQALFLLVIAPEFYLPLRTLGARFHNATESKAAAERVFEVLDTPIPVPSPEVPPLPVPERLSIAFEDVVLTYDDGTRRALRGVSFRVEAGQRVAVVGSSGSGKTSIAHLLLRLLTPDSGRITVGGCDLARLPAQAWRARIGWAGQFPYLFNTSIEENIRFGLPDASREQVIMAARAAGAHEFITQLPNGYTTSCGERGARLSGGQAQRIALARAFLRDAPLLILDEPTSQLDPQGEAEVLRTLDTLMRGRTVLLLAHRLQTVLSADRIIVLERGQVAEQGSHTQLYAAGGAYRRLLDSDGALHNA